MVFGFYLSRCDGELTRLQLAGKPLDLPPAVTVSHEEVLSIGKQKAEVMRQLVARIIEKIRDE